jgi:chromosome segregation ATPase
MSETIPNVTTDNLLNEINELKMRYDKLFDAHNNFYNTHDIVKKENKNLNEKLSLLESQLDKEREEHKVEIEGLEKELKRTTNLLNMNLEVFNKYKAELERTTKLLNMNLEVFNKYKAANICSSSRNDNKIAELEWKLTEQEKSFREEKEEMEEKFRKEKKMMKKKFKKEKAEIFTFVKNLIESSFVSSEELSSI